MDLNNFSYTILKIPYGVIKAWWSKLDKPVMLAFPVIPRIMKDSVSTQFSAF